MFDAEPTLKHRNKKTPCRYERKFSFMKPVPRRFSLSFHYHQLFVSRHPGSKSRDTFRRQKPWLAERGTIEQVRPGHRVGERTGPANAGLEETNKWEIRGRLIDGEEFY